MTISRSYVVQTMLEAIGKARAAIARGDTADARRHVRIARDYRLALMRGDY